ncbi:NAC domain-containing protein 55-like isoform X2 [Cornus florida]|uniref:NAC domain-containing protein 55-like isoform X2 n=1 Tax=Cornus florida TaxID=4283 RepID=UPI0028A11C91|nr:NAC domain-containing protein 55-like isoform X2 [Cornus florida]
MGRTKRKLNSPNSDSVKLSHVDHGRSGYCWKNVVPIGVRFHPQEWELFLYLRLKVEGKPIPQGTIAELDIYDYSPTQLNSIYGADVENMYFLTPLHKLGSRIQREALNGTWRKFGSKEVVDAVGTVGYKGSFNFEWKPHHGQDRFLMKEYTFAELNEWALVEIYPVKQIKKQNRNLIFNNWFREESSLNDSGDLKLSLSLPSSATLEAQTSAVDKTLKAKNKEMVSVRRLQVHDIATFVLNAAGYYEAQNCPNYFLSEASVALLDDHLPIRPSLIIREVVKIEKQTVMPLPTMTGTNRLTLNLGSTVNPCGPSTINPYSLPVGSDYFVVTGCIHSPPPPSY